MFIFNLAPLSMTTRGTAATYFTVGLFRHNDPVTYGTIQHRYSVWSTAQNVWLIMKTSTGDWFSTQNSDFLWSWKNLTSYVGGPYSGWVQQRFSSLRKLFLSQQTIHPFILFFPFPTTILWPHRPRPTKMLLGKYFILANFLCHRVNWLSRAGSPGSKIERCELRDFEYLARQDFRGFSIRF